MMPDFRRANTWDNGFRVDGRARDRVEMRLQGYVLAKAPPYNGDKPSWSRASRQPLPLSQEKLEAFSQKYRAETRKGPMTHFGDCTSKQQAVINRLTVKVQQAELDREAEWLLECVKRKIKRTRVSFLKETRETDKIFVIFKRQDRRFTRDKERMPSGDLGQYPLADIIDINEPANVDGLGLENDHLYDRNGPGPRDHLENFGRRDHSAEQDHRFRQQRLHEQNHQQELHDPFAGDRLDQGMQQDEPMDVYPVDPPKKKGKKGKKSKKVAEHFDDLGQAGAFEDPVGGQNHQQVNDNPWEGNPFEPNAKFNHPGAFDMPADLGPRDQRFNPRAPDERYARSRSRSRERRREAEEEARRFQEQRERDRLEWENENLREKLQSTENQYVKDKLNEVINKVDKWNVRDRRDSDSDRSLRDGGFWSPPASGGSFTPPSSPPLSGILDVGGPLGRSKSYRYKDSRGHRSKRYYDRDGRLLEPHYSTGQRRISYGDDYRRSNESFGRGGLPPIAPEARNYRRRDGKPILHQSRTWDDYPTAPFAMDDFDVVDVGRGREYERVRRGDVFDGERDRRGRSRRDASMWR